MALSKPVLYSYFRSSCSWRVRIALAYKGIEYDYKAVNLLKGEHLQEDFLKLNPAAEVPVLIHDGNVLTHSVAILEYLEEIKPSPSLLPKDPASRAKVRGLIDEIVAGIQPLQNMRVLKYVGEKDYATWAHHWVMEGFKVLEKALKDTHGTYCFGDIVTLADVCLVPQVFNAARFNVDMSQFPLVKEIASRLGELDAFKQSHPFAVEDCPPDLRA